jgi:hypothetical protein
MHTFIQVPKDERKAAAVREARQVTHHANLLQCST